MKISRKALVLLSILLIFVGGCDERTFGGKTIEQEFSSLDASMVRAALDNDISSFKLFVQKGADVNSVGSQGLTPLLWVLGVRDYKAAEILLQNGADPNHKIVNGDSAMSLAVGGNSAEALELLLKNGGDPNIVGEKKWHALNIAVFHSRWKHLDMLLDAGADVNSHGKYGDSAATTAVALGRFDKVNYLLDKGFGYDLDKLARHVQRRRVSEGSDACEWKQKVVKRLDASDVKFYPQSSPTGPDPCMPVLSD